MYSLTKILNVVLHGESNFCCLCLKIDQHTIYNEINVQFGETEQYVRVSSMLKTIFGTEIYEYWSALEKICEVCLEAILRIYTFIQTCQDNIKLLTQALDTLNASLTVTECKSKDSKALYMALNEKTLTSELTFDTKKMHSKAEALNRYQFLKSPKIPDMVLNKLQKKSDLSNIKIEDIIHDLSEEIPRCKECLKSYPSITSLQNHFMRVHASKNFKCPKCLKAFSLPTLVSRHLAMEHCKIVCSECGKIFSNKCSFNRHEITHKLQIVCPDCGRVYKNNLTYKKHIEFNVCKRQTRANPVDAQYTCDYCGKKYTQKMSLRVHIQYSHGNYKAHVCKWCDKKFWAQSRLKAHIVKHTKEKNFICSTCQGKFVTKESLLYHTRLHTGEKPYRCSQCDCTFISSSRRAYHMRTYHHLPLEECEGCHAKFTSQKYLDKHKKSHKQCQKVDKTESKLNSNKGGEQNKRKDHKMTTKETDNTSPGQNQLKDDLSNPETEEIKIFIENDEEYIFVESDPAN